MGYRGDEVRTNSAVTDRCILMTDKGKLYSEGCIMTDKGKVYSDL